VIRNVSSSVPTGVEAHRGGKGNNWAERGMLQVPYGQLVASGALGSWGSLPKAAKNAATPLDPLSEQHPPRAFMTPVWLSLRGGGWLRSEPAPPRTIIRGVCKREARSARSETRRSAEGWGAVWCIRGLNPPLQIQVHLYSCRAAVSQAGGCIYIWAEAFSIASHPNTLHGVSGCLALCFVREGVYFY